MAADPHRRNCSFCGHSARFTGPLVAGRAAHICACCADRAGRALAQGTVGGTGLVRTPRTIRALLDEAVIGQDAAKRLLSAAVYSHYKSLRPEAPTELSAVSTKGNILLVGPTQALRRYAERNGAAADRMVVLP